jgi:hypothetical protein
LHIFLLNTTRDATATATTIALLMLLLLLLLLVQMMGSISIARCVRDGVG